MYYNGQKIMAVRLELISSSGQTVKKDMLVKISGDELVLNQRTLDKAQKEVLTNIIESCKSQITQYQAQLEVLERKLK